MQALDTFFVEHLHMLKKSSTFATDLAKIFLQENINV